jgi:hypothetical protein
MHEAEPHLWFAAVSAGWQYVLLLPAHCLAVSPAFQHVDTDNTGRQLAATCLT